MLAAFGAPGVYHQPVTQAETIKKHALEAGFDLAGVAPLAAWDDLAFSRRWVEQGYGGEMHYLENPKRHDPRRVLPSARSVICAGLIYNADLPYSTEVCRGGPSPPSVCGNREHHEGFALEGSSPKGAPLPGRADADEPRAWISRYAWGRDYHEVMRSKLERLRGALEALAPGVETRVYADTGPIVERAFARLTGIGWMGKNTCLINQEKGSWFFLGVILTNLELAPDLPAPDRCGSCTRCIEACPTAALVEPYVMDASRCIAYFTIELRGSIPAEFRPALGANVFGCDICQDVCPWNSPPSSAVSGELEDRRHPSGPSHLQGMGGNPRRQVATTKALEFQPLHVKTARPAVSLFNPPLDALSSLTEDDFRQAFAHSPIKRAKYRGWLRNLCVAMGNSGDSRSVPWLERAREHPDPVVREHAEWALGRLRQWRSEASAGHDDADDAVVGG